MRNGATKKAALDADDAKQERAARRADHRTALLKDKELKLKQRSDVLKSKAEYEHQAENLRVKLEELENEKHRLVRELRQVNLLQRGLLPA